ncbi:unnamed protein product [Symbiodinium natans]|uniref:Uncharacterized protein n=1 Tax=Symbiodinium natans TaxID=878477 RepID=A0A812Q1J7_9DINO|nr:unnamed protein product [Symbiodinium natans]
MAASSVLSWCCVAVAFLLTGATRPAHWSPERLALLERFVGLSSLGNLEEAIPTEQSLLDVVDPDPTISTATAQAVERAGICRNLRGHRENHCKKYRQKDVCLDYDGCFWDPRAE